MPRCEEGRLSEYAHGVSRGRVTMYKLPQPARFRPEGTALQPGAQPIRQEDVQGVSFTAVFTGTLETAEDRVRVVPEMP